MYIDELEELDPENEIELAKLSDILDNTSKVSVEKLSKKLQSECAVRKAVCDKIASIYVGLFGKKEPDSRNEYSLWEFCDKKWNYEWNRITFLEVQNVYVECEATVKAILKVKDEEVLKKIISELLNKHSYVKSEDIFNYISLKISHEMNKTFEFYATFDDEYPPVMEDYDTNFEEVMGDKVQEFGMEIIDFNYIGYTSNYMS